MRCLILAGGKGKRLGSLGFQRPKALLEVGGRPMLWHVMDHAAAHGIQEFVVAAGHLGEAIHDAISAPPEGDPLRDRDPSWQIQVIDTGEETATGGRMRRLSSLLRGDEDVLVTYCDGLSDINLTRLVEFHRCHGRLATVAAVHPPSPFGLLDLDGDLCTGFNEKPVRLDTWINGGYFVVNRRAFDLIEGDGTVWEREPVSELVRRGELMAYRHHGYWSCVDTAKDIDRVEREMMVHGAPWLRVHA